MENFVDYGSVAELPAVLPAGRCCMRVEGRVSDCLEAFRIVRAGWPEYGRAILRWNPTVCRGATPPVPSIEVGARVEIVQTYDEGIGATRLAPALLFAGRIERVSRRMDASGMEIEYEARDVSAELERITVWGRRVLDSSGQAVQLAGSALCFNEDDEPNASLKAVQRSGRTYPVFATDFRRGRRWTCAQAVHYLLCEYLPVRSLGIPSEEALRSVMGDVEPGHTRAEGLSLLAALHELCEQAAVEFRFEPNMAEAGPHECIVFYRPGAGRSVELNCQPAGGQLDAAATVLSCFKSDRNRAAVHRIIVQGATQRFEATLALIQAWDPSLEGQDRSVYSPSSNPAFNPFRDVYRKWCLNEGGDYSGPPYMRGEPYDFAAVFETDEWVVRRRRFWPALSRAADGRSRGYVLETSFDGGIAWQVYAGSFDALDDECGVRLTSDDLGDTVWAAIQSGLLRFRITASVDSDERLMAIAADGPTGGVVPVIDRPTDAGDRFAYRKVSGQSIYYGGGDADEADDRNALQGYARTRLRRHRGIVETVDVETLLCMPHFQPGDRITVSPGNRDVLGVSADPRSLLWIDRAETDFEEQTTRLRILRSRKLIRD